MFNEAEITSFESPSPLLSRHVKKKKKKKTSKLAAYTKSLFGCAFEGPKCVFKGLFEIAFEGPKSAFNSQISV
jgi:hypothetical protein